MKKIINNPFFSAFLFAFSYIVMFYLLQFFFVRNSMLNLTPSMASLKSSDAGFYEEIARKGYEAGSNDTGFFILFPLLWRWIHVNIWGIVVVNSLLFSLGFAFLTRTLKEYGRITYLFWLTLPSVYFAFVPYSESLFFLLGAISLFALKEGKYKMLWISLLLISMVRATCVFLIPAFIAMELLSNPISNWGKSLWRSLYLYVAPMLAGLAIFIIWQYAATGIWFAYFKIQSTHWGHAFSWPGIPFTNIEDGGWRYHWLSATAMFIDVVALVFIIMLFVKWLKNNVYTDKITLVSAGYLMMVLISLLFLNPKYGNHTTNIMGANRYTLITPFGFSFLYFLSKQRYTNKQIGWVFLFLQLFWLLFGAYHHLDSYLVVAPVSNFLIIGFMLYASKEKYLWLIIPIIAIHFFAQMHLFQHFIAAYYVD